MIGDKEDMKRHLRLIENKEKYVYRRWWYAISILLVGLFWFLAFTVGSKIR